MKIPLANLSYAVQAGSRGSCLLRPRHGPGTLPATAILLCGAILIVASVGLPCPGAAESPSSDQQNEETAREHVADAQLKEPQSGWREELMTMPIDQVCSRLKSQELISYRLGPLLARGNPDDTISNGWTERQQPPFPLVSPIDWNRLRSVDRSWNYLLNSWRPLQSVLARHSETQQQDYLSFAFAVAEDWIHQHPYFRRELRNSADDFTW